MKAPAAHAKFNDRARKVAAGKARKIKVSEMPRREMLILYFRKARGYHVVPGRTSKFITMEKPGVEDKVFIGKNGSLREGRNISSVGWASHIDFVALRKWVNNYVAGGKK